MLLGNLTSPLYESRLFHRNICILEDGEGPKWKFDYSNFDNDPNPDILLLGAYRHPRTGNNLVGGINLHYLNTQQLNDLARALPKIMSGADLYNRYHIGRRLVPSVFRHSYRTYNSAYIHGVEQDVMYPKYGLLKTTKDWLKKKIGGMFKTPAQRQKEAEPKYPNDISNMQQRLNQAVVNLQKAPPPDVPPESPEMQAARRAFYKYRKEQQPTTQDVENLENEPIAQVQQNREIAQNPGLIPEIPLDQIGPEVTNPETELEPTDLETPEKEAEQIQQITSQRRSYFERDRQNNKAELAEPVTPEDEEDLRKIDNPELEECIIYYSPRYKKYIMEHVDIKTVV